MCVDGFEAGALEGGRHFQLAVHALLAQDRDARPAVSGDERRRRVRLPGEADERTQTRVVGVRRAFVGLARALRIVAQGLYAEGKLGPGAVEVGTGGVEQDLRA